MKKVYFSMLAVFAMATAFAQINVTFQVDMAGQTVGSGVYVAGDFNSWNSTANALTQVGATSIYSGVVSMPAGKHEFKFVNGTSWENVPNECAVGNGNGNRWVGVRSAVTTAAVQFGQCAPVGQNSIQLMVDMSQLTSLDDTISVAGNFQGWSPGSTIMTDVTSDSIFRTIAYVPAGDTIQFKYINGTKWAQNETVPGACAVGGNREVIATGNIIAGPVCFNMCGPCFVPDTFDVTIRVDLSTLCATVDSVDIAGPLNGWAGGDMMTDMGNGIWEITVRQAAPSFKFKARYFGDGSSSPNWEGGGDKEPVFSSDTVLPIRCFGADVYGACAPKPAPADITFRVDFAQSNYSPATDIYLIGDFTGYQTNAIKLDPTPGHPGVYETTVVGFCPAAMNFKFVNGDLTVPANEENPGIDSCGVPNGVGGYNRFFQRPDANPHTLQFIFDSCQTIFIGVEENLLSQNVNITPNPFSATAVVDLGDDTYTMTIMDVAGRIVRQVNGATGNVVVDREGMKAGIYFMNAVNSKGQARTAKFVVE